MWENAERFNAMLVFAEHRYYGESHLDKDLTYLSHEEALADYVSLIEYLKDEY